MRGFRAMVTGLSALLALVALVALPGAARAQSYPTGVTAGTISERVPGHVSLQCDSGITACTPPTTANPVPVSVVSGGGSTPTGTAGSPNASVVTVQGIAGGTAQAVGGNVASGAADSGNPVKIGCKYNATLPTFTDGLRADAQCSSQGIQLVQIRTSQGQEPLAGNFTSDGNLGANALWVNALGGLYNGTTYDRQRGDANGMVVQAGLSSTAWTYASGTTGILNNTTVAVTFKAAAGAGVRNFVDGCQISTTAFTTSVPLAVRDGAGGAVIWSLVVPTVGFTQPFMLVFQTPLRSTANTLLEIVTTTANTTGTVMVNCQGHTGP